MGFRNPIVIADQITSGKFAGTYTIAGLMIVGNPAANHVAIGTDAHGADGVRLYGSDGVTPLIDLNIASTPTITGALIRTAATGARIEMSGGALDTLKWFSGDPGEAENAYVATSVNAGTWGATSPGGDTLGIIMQSSSWQTSNPRVSSFEAQSGSRNGSHGAYAKMTGTTTDGFHEPGVIADGDFPAVVIGLDVFPLNNGGVVGALTVNLTANAENVQGYSHNGSNQIFSFSHSSGTLGALTWDGNNLTANGSGVTSRSGSSGWASLRTGAAPNTGYIEFFGSNGVRQGYIGWGDANAATGDQGKIFYTGGTHQFSGAIQGPTAISTSGTITAGSRISTTLGNDPAGIQLLSGSSANYAGITIGRASADLVLGVSASSGQFFAGGAAGSGNVASQTAGSDVRIGPGVDNSGQSFTRFYHAFGGCLAGWANVALNWNTGDTSVHVVNGANNAFAPIHASAFTVGSSWRDVKENLRLVDETALDVIRSAPAYFYDYVKAPTALDGSILSHPLRETHGKKWGEQRGRMQVGPMLDDLAAHPVGRHAIIGDGYDLKSVVGFLWGAVAELDNRTRSLTGKAA